MALPAPFAMEKAVVKGLGTIFFFFHSFQVVKKRPYPDGLKIMDRKYYCSVNILVCNWKEVSCTGTTAR